MANQAPHLVGGSTAVASAQLTQATQRETSQSATVKTSQSATVNSHTVTAAPSAVQTTVSDLGCLAAKSLVARNIRKDMNNSATSSLSKGDKKPPLPGTVEDQSSDKPTTVDQSSGKPTTEDQSLQTTPEGTPATDIKNTEKTVVEFHKPSWKERTIARISNAGSYVAAPFKFVGLIIWKSLDKYAFTLISEGLLYIFQPAKYDARKIGLEVPAGKAAHELKQANDRALEKECIDLARARWDKITTQLRCSELAAKYGVDPVDVKERVDAHQPHQNANKLLMRTLAEGKLELIKKDFCVDPETGEKLFTTHVVCGDNGQILDADKADVAKRLGNDPALKQEMEKYNESVAACENVLIDKPTVVPVRTSKPVFKCTDKYLIQAFRNGSSKYLSNAKTKEKALKVELDNLYAKLEKDYPGQLVECLESGISISDDYGKTRVEESLKSAQKEHEECQARLASLKAEAKNENHSTLPSVRERPDKQDDEIVACQRRLEFYSKKVELYTVRNEMKQHESVSSVYQECRAADITDRESRDRLNTKDWKASVTKDEEGNIITKYPQEIAHRERTFVQMITPEHNGRKMPNPVPYKDQQGLKWSKANPENHAYDSYVAVKGDGKILKDREGNTMDWEAAPGRCVHWIVKRSCVNGKHEGYEKKNLAVKKPNQSPIDASSSPPAPAPAPAMTLQSTN